MSFLKKLTNFFLPPSTSKSAHYPIQVICSRCGETITGSINLNNDLTTIYGSTESDYTYFCRKVLLGEARCFQQIEVELTFDRSRRLTERKIRGGKFADEPT